MLQDVWGNSRVRACAYLIQDDVSVLYFLSVSPVFSAVPDPRVVKITSCELKCTSKLRGIEQPTLTRRCSDLSKSDMEPVLCQRSSANRFEIRHATPHYMTAFPHPCDVCTLVAST